MENIILFTPFSTYILSFEINVENRFKSMINMTFHFDLRGSTTAITDTSGNVTDQIVYGPYGELISKTGTTKTPFLFNGRDGVITDNNGLYYMRARYYNPEIKRFINQDVIQGNILAGGSLNRYAYVNGNPVSKTDPFGLSSELTPSKIGHTILDVLGFIPVIGEFANAANAIWYLAEGDYLNAALSAVCLLPYVGAGIVKGVKWGSAAFKEAKIGMEIVGYSSKVLEYGKNVGRAISESASMFGEAWGKVNKGVTLSSNGIRSGNLGKVFKEFKELKLAAKEAGETEKIAKSVGKEVSGHTATWEHLGSNGNVIDHGVVESGGSNLGRRLSWEEQLQTHTERKILNQLESSVSSGDTIIINGTKPPCNPGRSVRPSRGCQGAMQNFSKDNGVNILYFMEGDKMPWIFPW